MRRRLCPSLFLALLLPCGCSEGVPAPAVPVGTTSGPHGGIALPLPDGAGFAELLLEKESPAKGKSRTAGPGARPRFAVFFLSPDLKGPADPLPGDVRIKAVLPTGTTADVALKPSPREGDPAGKARFLSEPGDYDYDELSGELTATLAGRTASVPFALR